MNDILRLGRVAEDLLGGTEQRTGEPIVKFTECLLVTLSHALQQTRIDLLALIRWQRSRGSGWCHPVSPFPRRDAIPLRHGVEEAVGKTGN